MSAGKSTEAASDATLSPAAIDIPAVQTALGADGLDGWLLYDFRGLNSIAAELTGVNHQSGHLATRRWYYLIPAAGEPRGLVHTIERHSLAHLPVRQPAHPPVHIIFKMLRIVRRWDRASDGGVRNNPFQ